MTTWYQINPRMYRKEQAALEAVQPGLSLDIQPPGSRINAVCGLKCEHVIAAGVYTFRGEETGYYDYRIAVLFPGNYPASPCVLYCNDPKLPIGNLDRHILSNGQACLALPGEMLHRWKPSGGIVGFFEDFVSPFLAWQVYYDAEGRAPPWGQRAHGLEGIIEFYAEALGIPIESNIAAFMPFIARKNYPKGHETCPCGSGLRLRHCHAAEVREARSFIPWECAQQDLSVVSRIEGNRPHGEVHATLFTASKPSSKGILQPTTTAAGDGKIRAERR